MVFGSMITSDEEELIGTELLNLNKELLLITTIGFEEEDGVDDDNLMDDDICMDEGKIDDEDDNLIEDDKIDEDTLVEDDSIEDEGVNDDDGSDNEDNKEDEISSELEISSSLDNSSTLDVSSELDVTFMELPFSFLEIIFSLDPDFPSEDKLELSVQAKRQIPNVNDKNKYFMTPRLCYCKTYAINS